MVLTFEVLAQRDLLALVIGGEFIAAIQPFWWLYHSLEAELTDSLAVLDREWHVMSPDLESRLTACEPVAEMPEARVEEPRIMRP